MKVEITDDNRIIISEITTFPLIKENPPIEWFDKTAKDPDKPDYSGLTLTLYVDTMGDVWGISQLPDGTWSYGYFQHDMPNNDGVRDKDWDWHECNEQKHSWFDATSAQYWLDKKAFGDAWQVKADTEFTNKTIHPDKEDKRGWGERTATLLGFSLYCETCIHKADANWECKGDNCWRCTSRATIPTGYQRDGNLPDIVMIPEKAVEVYRSKNKDKCKNLNFYQVRDLLAREILTGSV